MIRSSCGTENESSRKFCGECGAPGVDLPELRIAQLLPEPSSAGNGNRTGRCGRIAVLGADECEALGGAATRLGAVRRPGGLHHAVGIARSEEVRELLSRYFDTSRPIIARYGGTVEKFIGDAVMAVWGAPRHGG